MKMAFGEKEREELIKKYEGNPTQVISSWDRYHLEQTANVWGKEGTEAARILAENRKAKNS